MVSSRRKKIQIVCSVLIFFAVVVMPLEGIGSPPVQAANPSSGQEAPGLSVLEQPPPPKITENHPLAIDKAGNVTLTYSMSDRRTARGVAAAHNGENSSQVQPASIVIEAPLESKAVEPKKTGLAATGWQNIMIEDFEGTFPSGLWATLDNDGVTNGEFYWDDDDYKPHGGSWSAWCANGGANGLDPQFYYYPDNMDAWMVYGPFSLADATDAELNFYQWSDTQFDHDYLLWLASIDGTYFYGWSVTGTSSGWVGETFDLTAVAPLGNLCGQSQVWIAFRFTSDDETVLRDGAFIDDIVLRKYVAGAMPHIDSLSPNDGPVDTRVVIGGSGFGPTQGASTVTFGGVNADVSSWSDAQIVAWVPEGAGSNIVVHTTQGDSNAVSFTITDSPVDYWAVIVGVEDYPGTEDDLDYPNEDAWDVHGALLAGPNWEEGHISILLDSDATKANIHSAITEMGSNGDGNDLFFFYYSGHGGNAADHPPIDETDALDEYLAQYDYATDPIWDDELAEWLAALPSRKVAVSLDACYSGGQVKASSEGLVRCVVAGGVPARGDGFVRDIDDIIGGVALAASAEDEVGYEDPALQNGVFTYYFVGGLGGPADSNADDQISMEEAFNYLEPLVSGSKPQNPQIYDGYPGELVILSSELNNPPNTPANPSPANHATNVSINTDLGWTGGDPDAGDTVTYDVYFGTSATPPPFSNDQPGSTCDPGTLNYSTKYYWYVAAMDNHGASVTGPLWDFTTQSESAEPTEVSISPPIQGVAGGDSFSVNVVIDPKVAIAGVQFSLSFDPALLTANGVTEGNLLKQGGASTFFMPGTINNVAGTITGVAGAILGVGQSVSSVGTFATISFAAKMSAGTSPLDLSDVQVGDTNAIPVAITVTDGSVTIGVWDDWDVNMDGWVNVLDMVLVGMHWGETGTAHWIRPDVSRDGAINVLDMIPIGQHWTG